MKLVRANYPGASEFAQFDCNLADLDAAACRGLLEHILHEASPGAQFADAMYEALGPAEERWKECRELGVGK